MSSGHLKRAFRSLGVNAVEQRETRSHRLPESLIAQKSVRERTCKLQHDICGYVPKQLHQSTKVRSSAQALLHPCIHQFALLRGHTRGCKDLPASCRSVPVHMAERRKSSPERGARPMVDIPTQSLHDLFGR